MISTSGFLAALECIKFFFGRGSAPDPAGELTALPRLPSWFKVAYFYGERDRRERGKREGKGRGRVRRRRKGAILCSPKNSLEYALEKTAYSLSNVV